MQNHKQTLDRAWRILKRGGEMIVGARGVKTSQENSQNHRVSQGLKQQLGSQHGTDLGPLHVCCVPSSSYGTLNSGNRDCLWLFYWLLGPYSLYRVTLPNINTWGGAQSSCNLICLNRNRGRGEWGWGRNRGSMGGGTGQRGGRGNGARAGK